MPISIAGNRRNKQGGFSYAIILVAVIAMGIIAESATVQTSRVVEREREQELLFRGIAYRNAIRSYYEAGKPVKSYPKSLEDLVKDPRSAHKPHLRALYADPMVKGDAARDNGGWKLIRAMDGGISGVSSSSKSAPLKTANFPKGLEKPPTPTGRSNTSPLPCRKSRSNHSGPAARSRAISVRCRRRRIDISVLLPPGRDSFRYSRCITRPFQSVSSGLCSPIHRRTKLSIFFKSCSSSLPNSSNRFFSPV
jgi:type II secretory pathway pseudopilin PulG